MISLSFAERPRGLSANDKEIMLRRPSRVSGGGP